MTASYLQGDFAPVPDEIETGELAVEGVLPAELEGRYLRNGPNPPPGRDPGNWFMGDGMLHGIRLRDGRAQWYRNRWVRTGRLAGRPFIGRSGIDLSAVAANTNVVRHAGRILALVESGFPYEVDRELGTVGPCDFGGRLTTAMTAHPKEDPLTGELHSFGYGFTPPYLTYHRMDASGELVESREIRVPGPTMMHDFAITENHVVWLDLPVVFDLEMIRSGLPYRWDDAYGARIGLMSRRGDGAVRWFDIDPCYVFHVGNAWEDASGRVVVDAVHYPRDVFVKVLEGIGGASDPAAQAGGSGLHRWTLDPVAGTAKEGLLDDCPVEFPTIDDRRTGLPYTRLYTVNRGEIVKYDTATGSATVHRTQGMPGEAVFVPRSPDGAEDDGWLLSLIGSRAELRVLDARDLSHVASVRLPRRVPEGFHGAWIGD
ncbi:carotenoid oxygenase family protein [Actinocorallia populi]|uniref:carotenoid oxygenase family protein n=1 Tax=Actinocorallia populi TaxID=2079200 RepID=UPI000D089A55|nr:carotenoid oxygenase family protein [Actinocorallia populi]